MPRVRPVQGESGGFRTIILYHTTEHAFFVYGFAKSNRENHQHGRRPRQSGW
ncbi:type II toxin-antitoxin system RelE/ParE family toxin [Alcaligenaceae bacterium]|nr:type II toxin-antitoxin system RelE/ParE family toxin [Alcaligenaceae bacterium]